MRLALLGSIALAIVAVVSWLIAWRLARRTGLDSAARVIASDVGRHDVRTFYDETRRLYGRPDYLLRERTGDGVRVVPVEVKPTRRATRLYESDEMELVTYLLLARASYPSTFAGYGLVRYAETTFRVELTEERERRCLAYAALVRQTRRAERGSVHRSHSVPARCVHCAARHACDEALA